MLRFVQNNAEIACVLFDLDGTLVTTHIDFRRMRDEIRSFSTRFDVPENLFAGKDVLEMIEAGSEYLANDGAAFKRSAWTILEAIEVDGCANPIEINGANDLLEMLASEDVKIGVVTRNCRAVSVSLLAQFHLRCDVLLTRDDVARTKPNPAHLHDAMKLLDVSPHHTVMIGDHFLDIRAGNDAGCAGTVGVLGERDPSWFAPAPPSAIVRNLREALPLFAE